MFGSHLCGLNDLIKFLVLALWSSMMTNNTIAHQRSPPKVPSTLIGIFEFSDVRFPPLGIKTSLHE